MDQITLFYTETIYWLKLLTIPFIAGFIGWFTNWQAIKMTFKPLEFFGIKIGKLKIGWQGIIPANAGKMARIGVELMTEKLIKVEEIFDRMDAEEVAKAMSPQMRDLTEKVVNQTMSSKIPAIWNRIPKNIKKIIFDSTEADIPKTIVDMLNDIKTNHEKLLNFKKMYIESILKDKELLNELFMRCGKAEFKFIEYSGFWFGFFFGIPQMLAWHYYPASWTLPVAGIIVGYATNWLALKLIFKPVKEIKFLNWKIQGLFIKRQEEVSEEYADFVAKKILTAENIWEFMLNENGGEAMYNLIETHVKNTLQNMTDGNVNNIAMVIAPKQYEEIKNSIIKDFVFRLPMNLKNLYGTLDKSFDIKSLLFERMRVMSPKDFVAVLRPAFEEEEWILIVVGAVLGGIAGLAQWAFVFGGWM